VPAAPANGGTPLWFVPIVGIAVGALRGHVRYGTAKKTS
jgi:hypothetical protein